MGGTDEDRLERNTRTRLDVGIEHNRTTGTTTKGTTTGGLQRLSRAGGVFTIVLAVYNLVRIEDLSVASR